MACKQSRLGPIAINNFYTGYEHIICSEVLETSSCSLWKCQSYCSKLFCSAYLPDGINYSSCSEAPQPPLIAPTAKSHVLTTDF